MPPTLRPPSAATTGSIATATSEPPANGVKNGTTVILAVLITAAIVFFLALIAVLVFISRQGKRRRKMVNFASVDSHDEPYRDVELDNRKSGTAARDQPEDELEERPPIQIMITRELSVYGAGETASVVERARRWSQLSWTLWSPARSMRNKRTSKTSTPLFPTAPDAARGSPVVPPKASLPLSHASRRTDTDVEERHWRPAQPSRRQSSSSSIGRRALLYTLTLPELVPFNVSFPSPVSSSSRQPRPSRNRMSGMGTAPMDTVAEHPISDDDDEDDREDGQTPVIPSPFAPTERHAPLPWPITSENQKETSRRRRSSLSPTVMNDDDRIHGPRTPHTAPSIT